MIYTNPRDVWSPSDYISDVEIFFDGGEDGYSLAKIVWDGRPAIGIRWNISMREWENDEKLREEKTCRGMPLSYTHPVWFILPDDLFESETEANTAFINLIERIQEERQASITINGVPVIQMILHPGAGTAVSRRIGLREIRDFSHDADELIIMDPYILSGETTEAEKYLEEFKRSTRIDNGQLKKITLIFNTKMGVTNAIRKGIKDLAQQHKCLLVLHDTNKIHDRFWIKNRDEGIIVGTSFGGLGNKVCIIERLSGENFSALLSICDNEGLLQENYR